MFTSKFSFNLSAPEIQVMAGSIAGQVSSAEQSASARDLLSEMYAKISGAGLQTFSLEGLLTRGNLGEPLLPAPYKCSISHSSKGENSRVAAALSSAEDLECLGIDLEAKNRQISPELFARILSNTTDASCLSYLKNKPPIFTFCSLEAAYKVISPMRQEYFDLRNIALSLQGENLFFSYKEQQGSLTEVVYDDDYFLLVAWCQKS